ncbi:MAG: type II toxin-antitoxin system HicB family antitoxin [Patescibacteria group bacterium]
MKAVYKHKEIQLTAEVWKEGGTYVSYVPQLDISSCGETVDEARKNIREAAELFIEGLEKNGTLTQVLEEAGFTLDDNWKAPELVAFEKMKLAL